ncbi:hypothetical protein GW17_00012735 [Ensete ventricosum]|nr:hypothetical protein GW17_00012735 [Ensete ventricosum]RZR89163.1 hypothetical protein BHM03_00016832 [Ensete ventricosum]
MSSTLITNTKNLTSSTEGNSLVPWLKSLSSASYTSTSSKLPNLHHLYIHGGSISAPVTPPLSSPTARSKRIKIDCDVPASHPTWTGSNLTFLPSSVPPSPGHQDTPESAWLAGLRLPSGGPSSPTFSLISSNPLVFYKEASGARMLTPGQSGTCSPVPGGHGHGDVQMSDGGSDEFEFGSSSNGTDTATGLVKPWEGEMIHEECASYELDLTLGIVRLPRSVNLSGSRPLSRCGGDGDVSTVGLEDAGGGASESPDQSCLPFVARKERDHGETKRRVQTEQAERTIIGWMASDTRQD